MFGGFISGSIVDFPRQDQAVFFRLLHTGTRAQHTMLLTVLLSVVTVASVTADKTVYGLLGGAVDFEPDAGSVTDATKSILWKVGKDKAIEWDVVSTDYYRYFKERGYLNNLTGVMTLTGLLFSDSNTYTPEIDDKVGTPIQLLVLSAVPEPTIEKVFLTETNEYRLSCTGSIERAGTVTYTWKSDDNKLLSNEKDYTIKEDSSEKKTFTCEMKNPVSQKSSKPLSYPFSSSTATTQGLNIHKGAIAFLCLFIPLVLLVVFHRVKTGVCFYNKSSLPWEKDFWMKNDRQPLDQEQDQEQGLRGSKGRTAQDGTSDDAVTRETNH